MSTNLNMASVNKIKELVARQDFKAALKEMKTIDVEKSLNPQFMQLCGQVYAENKKFDQARKILISAHILAPKSTEVLNELIRLYLKMGYFTKAKKYYKIYTACAPKEGIEAQTVLYNMKKAMQAPDQELIQILENICKQEYVAEWAFELALLYRKAGMNEQSVQECDKIMKSFGHTSIYAKWARPLRMGSINIDRAFNCYPKEEVAETTGTIYQSVQEENAQLRKDYEELFGTTDPAAASNDAVIVEEVDDDDAISVAAQITDTVKSTVSSAFGKVKDSIKRPLDEEVEVEIVQDGEEIDSEEGELLRDGDAVQDNGGNPFMLEEDTVAARQQELEEATGEIADIKATLERIARQTSKAEEDAENANFQQEEEDAESIAAAAQELAAKLAGNTAETGEEETTVNADVQASDAVQPETSTDRVQEEEMDTFDLQALMQQAAQSEEEITGQMEESSASTDEEPEQSISFVNMQDDNEIEFLDLDQEEAEIVPAEEAEAARKAAEEEAARKAAEEAEAARKAAEEAEAARKAAEEEAARKAAEEAEAARKAAEEEAARKAAEEAEAARKAAEEEAARKAEEEAEAARKAEAEAEAARKAVEEAARKVEEQQNEDNNFNENDNRKKEALDMAEENNKPKLSLKLAGGGGAQGGGMNRSSFPGAGRMGGMRGGIGGAIVSKEEQEFMAKYDAKQAEREAAAKERARKAKEKEARELAAKQEAKRLAEKAAQEAAEAAEKAAREARIRAEEEAKRRKEEQEKAEEERARLAELRRQEEEEQARLEELRRQEQETIRRQQEEERAKQEAQERERIERERKEAARKAEEELRRQEQEAEKQRQEAEEAARKAEEERLAAERAERERIEEEKKKAEEAARKAEEERVAKEKAEQERLRASVKKVRNKYDQEREDAIAAIRAKVEAERAAKEERKRKQQQILDDQERRKIKAMPDWKRKQVPAETLERLGIVIKENGAIMTEEEIAQMKAEKEQNRIDVSAGREEEHIEIHATRQDDTQAVKTEETGETLQNSGLTGESLSDMGLHGSKLGDDHSAITLENAAFVGGSLQSQEEALPTAEEEAGEAVVEEKAEETEESAVEEKAEETEESAVEEKAEETEESAVEEKAEGTEESAVEEKAEETAESAVEEKAEETEESAVEEKAEGTEESAVEEKAEETEESAVEEKTEETEESAVEEKAEGTAEEKIEETAEPAVEEKTEETMEPAVEEKTEKTAESVAEEAPSVIQLAKDPIIEDTATQEVSEEQEEPAVNNGFVMVDTPKEQTQTGFVMMDTPEPELERSDVKPEEPEQTEELERADSEAEPEQAEPEKPEEPAIEEVMQDTEVKHDVSKVIAGVEFDKNGIPFVAEKYIGKYVASSAVRKQFRKPLENVIRKRGVYRNIVILARKGCTVSNVAIDFARTYHELGLCKTKIVATIKAKMLNKTDMNKILPKLRGGCLIIEQAGDLSREKALEVFQMVNNPDNDIVLMIVGEVMSVTAMFGQNSELNSLFHGLFLLHDLSDLDLTDIAIAYMKEHGYDADMEGMRALKSRIANLEHNGIDNVLAVVDAAIAKAVKRSQNNLADVVFLDDYEDSGLNLLKEFDFE